MYGLIIEREKGHSQYRQLYEQLRGKIIRGEIAPSTKLLSTRQLASDLNISRSIVLEVIDQLKVEGFLETRHGSGTYVIPALSLPGESPEPTSQRNSGGKGQSDILSFIAGMPDLSIFPKRAWNRVYSRSVEYARPEDLSYNHPKGRYELRTSLCQYLYRTKGIRTTESRIFLTAGSAQALAVLSELKKEFSIKLEDPCAGFVHDIFKSKKGRIFPAEADGSGLVTENLSLKGMDFLYLSPSHQYPLGGTVPAARRVDILKKARREGTFVIEDDYDGEFRFASRPISPLQVLAPEQVVYIGTFSKILSPALRIGYMVVPEELIAPIMAIKKRWDFLNESLNQMAMSRFIDGGHIYRHLRTALKFYGEKKSTAEELIAGILGDKWEIGGNTTGLHMVMRLGGYDFSGSFRKKMMDCGILFEPAANYCHHMRSHRDTLVFGYGHRTAEEMEKGLTILSGLI